MRKLTRYLGLGMLLVGLSQPAWAQTSTPTLALSATLASALKLTVATSSSPAGLAVTGGPNAYTLASFGNIDGIGLATPAAGVTAVPNITSATCSTAGEAWVTPISMTAKWSGAASATSTIKVSQSSITLGGATGVAMASSPNGVVVNEVTPTNLTLSSILNNNTAFTSYVGWLVCGNSTYTSGTGVSGTLQFTLTVP